MFDKTMVRGLMAGAMALCFFAGDLQANNLVFNGDFQLGNTGFATDYTYVTDDTNQGQYGIVNNPNTSGFLGSRAASYYDHTTGGTDGLMMCVDGDGPSMLVWGSTCSVAPDTYYNFTCWASTTTYYSAELPDLANLTVTFNADSPFTFTAPGDTADWQPYSTFWYSGGSTSVVLAMVDNNSDFLGNDFALDDISLTAVPEPGSITLLAVSAFGLAACAWRRQRLLREARQR